MGVGEQRLGHPELGGLGVHGRHEGLVGGLRIVGLHPLAQRLGDGDGSVVARGDHESRERRLKGERVARPQTRRRLAHLRGLLAHRHRAVQGHAGVQRDDGGHNLGDGGDVRPLEGAPREEHRALVVHDQREGRRDIRTDNRRQPARLDGGTQDLVGAAHVGEGPCRRAQRQRKQQSQSEAERPP